MKHFAACILVLVVGCSESSPATDSSKPESSVSTDQPESKKPSEAKESTPKIVSLSNAHSVKRFLETEFDAEFDGFTFENESVDVTIHGSEGRLYSLIVVFQEPLSDDTIEKAVLLARKILIAAGEDAREVENKIDRGRLGYAEDSDGVELNFSDGTYARFSVWSKGGQDRAGVVIEPE